MITSNMSMVMYNLNPNPSTVSVALHLSFRTKLPRAANKKGIRSGNRFLVSANRGRLSKGFDKVRIVRKGNGEASFENRFTEKGRGLKGNEEKEKEKTRVLIKDIEKIDMNSYRVGYLKITKENV